MANHDKLRHDVMMWGMVLSLVTTAGTAYWLVSARTDLSDEAYRDSMDACDDAASPETCRQRVEDFHDDCYRWSLTRHDEYPELDRVQYATCLEHPPGKFRDSSN